MVEHVRRGMQNVDIHIEGETLVIRVNLSLDFGPSKSGKTRIIGTTGGAIPVGSAEAGVMINLNVYR